MTPLDPEAFRTLMRHVPSTVTVVTAGIGDSIRGVTIGSFTSLSLTPPLLCFNLGRRSQMYSVLRTTSNFAVHVLSGRQASLSQHFAKPGQTSADQFDSIAYTRSDDGTPLLHGAAATLQCRLHQFVDVNEKVIVIGEVVAAESDAEASVLLYYRRTYAGLNGTVYPAEDSGVGYSHPFTLLPAEAS